MRYGEIRLSRADMINLMVFVKSTVASIALNLLKITSIQLEREYPPWQAQHANQLRWGVS